MKTLTILSGLFLSAFGAWMSATPEKEVSTSATSSPETLQNKGFSDRQAAPPAGIPFTFNIHFRTTSGEVIDTVATYSGDGLIGADVYSSWKSPPVTYTIDHRNLDIDPGPPIPGIVPWPPIQVTGPRVIHYPVEVIYSKPLNAWKLRLGVPKAPLFTSESLLTAGSLNFPDFVVGSIGYSEVRVSP